MKKRLCWLLFATALALVAAPALRADDAPVPSARFEVERMRQHLQELREHARHASSASPSASVQPRFAPSISALPVGSATPPPKNAEELARKWAALAATRLERRAKHRENLVRQLGAHLSEPDVAAELKLHATRLAELSRVEFLAQNAREGAAQERLLARVSKLVARESERHRRRLATLTAAPVGSASSAPAPRPSGEGPP